jgi:hypothetical protein
MTLPFAPLQRLVVVSCLFCERDIVGAFLDRDLPKIERGPWCRQQGPWTVDDCYLDVPPPGAAHKKTVLVFSPPSHKYTLLIANLEDGWSSLAFRASRAIGVNALVLGFCVDAFPSPARFFSWIERGDLVRHVSVRLDNRWIFFQKGSPLSPERLEQYNRKRIRDRLTNRQLVELSLSFGVIALDRENTLAGVGSKFFQP